MAQEKQPVLIIAGPTASGKSGLALSVSALRRACIINADSMQVYDGLPILTAQPPAGDLAKAPHKLYGALHPARACTAARWKDMALEEIALAHAAGRLPVVTGGTGFYLKTLTDGISPVPEVPQEVRDALMARQAAEGTQALYDDLKSRDPETAAGLDPFNTQRVVRALEVLEHTGTGLAQWQKAPREAPPAHLAFKTAVLLPPRDKLYANCDLRFDIMLKEGAIEEAVDFKSRIASGEVPEDAALCKALGFPELSAFLDGRMTRDEAAEAAKTATRHYAKRQMTWFRNQVRADIVLESPDAPRVAALADI